MSSAVLEGENELSLQAINRDELIQRQKGCEELKEIFEAMEKGERGVEGYCVRNGVLMYRKKNEEDRDFRVVVPKSLRVAVLRLCHDKLAHAGSSKIKARLARYFFWKKMYIEAEKYVKHCDVCQRTQKHVGLKKAEMQIVPIIRETFSKVNADITGPLPVSKRGNRYILTVMCLASKFPEAIPMKEASSLAVTDGLLAVFSRLGFPREIQVDHGTHFTSQLTTNFFKGFGIRVSHSAVYRPESNPIERLHGTLKKLLRGLCAESGDEWDVQLPLALFAIRTMRHESTGFTPSELVFGKNLRSPETLIYENWVNENGPESNVVEHVFNLINKLHTLSEKAVENMEEAREKRKVWYDRNAITREFSEGDRVLVLATGRPNKMALFWEGPGQIEKKISAVNYLVRMEGKRGKARTYHVNMLKPYYQPITTVNGVQRVEMREDAEEEQLDPVSFTEEPNEFDFVEVERNSDLVDRLSPKQITQLRDLLGRYARIFSSRPGRTHLVEHDVELISPVPVKIRPYKSSRRQVQIMEEEIRKMLELRVIKAGESDYASPMIIVETPGKDPRPCIDFRKLNEHIKTEYFPLPNLEERVERVASAKYITLLDLSKGYWQIPLTPRAQRIAAFVTPFGAYQPLVLPFGLKNAPFFFSKLMAELLKGLEAYAVPYLDDIAIYSEGWELHLKHVEEVLNRLKGANLTLKPTKCKFAQFKVRYLGHLVGQGARSPVEAKVAAIADFPTPACKRNIRSFLGITGYYSNYIPNYSMIAAPLTDALKGKDRQSKIVWSEECENAFRTLKRALCSSPVLRAPDFNRPFTVHVDASLVGVGVVLSQFYDEQEHPVVYLSKKFNETQRNYSTTERECFGLVYAVQKLHYYLDGVTFDLFVDHNPLVWLQKSAPSNSKLMRWSLYLQQYNFNIKYRKGKDHLNADALSRAHEGIT